MPSINMLYRYALALSMDIRKISSEYGHLVLLDRTDYAVHLVAIIQVSIDRFSSVFDASTWL
jgi:hypothetical protein